MRLAPLIVALALAACGGGADAGPAQQQLIAIKKPAAGVGSWLVTWTAPINEAGVDAAAAGTPASFTVKWGATAGGPYPNSHTTANGSTVTYTITGLTAGTWYVVVTANNAAGESDPSFEETKVIP